MPMNGHVSRSVTTNNNSCSSRNNLGATAHSAPRDVNGLAALKKDTPVGRYTVISRTVSKRNGNTVKPGVYQPTNIGTLDANRRAQSQQHVERSYAGMQTQNAQNGPNRVRCTYNGALCKSVIDTTTTDGDDQVLTKYSNSQHYKSHSVTSTFFLRDTNNRSVGGSLSCGQPSPSSTTEDSVVSALSPTSARTESRPQHQSFWLHQSELVLPTDRGVQVNGLTNGVAEKRTVSVIGLERNSCERASRSLTNIHPDEQQCHYSSNMLYGGSANRDGTEEYLGSSALGPSHRKIQTLHGTGGAQRRFPSDTTLNFTQRDGGQVYTSGSKPGPVTIPARSRSAQPSPGPSPLASPTTFYRVGEQNAHPDYLSDKRSRVTRSQQIDLQYSGGHRGTSSPPNLEKQKIGTFTVNGIDDDSESPILPSVREIIRQVEAMTQSNAATSTTDISTVGQGAPTSGIPRFQRPAAQTRGTDPFARTGILRQSGSSQRTPSAPQLRSMQYTPIQAKFNSIAAAAAQNRNVAPPVPPHGTTRSKAIIGAFTRRADTALNDSAHQSQRFEFSSNTPVNKKTELLSHLPTDYQKLREAFIEQRREIQRLRKQLADKDLLISQLQSDIRLYEPWR